MVTVGIDPHKHVHVAVAVDAAGRPVGKPLTFKSSALQVTVLLTWIRGIAGGSPVTWAIKDGRGFARRLDDAIRDLVTPLAPNLLAITGISHTSAAVLIAEIGDITRFPTSAKLARYAGCAPIPVYSSDKERHRLHRGGNRRLNSVTYTAAIVQKRWLPEAQDLLARHEPAKGSRGARRILQRHLIDAIYRAMTADRKSWQHDITQHPLTA